MSRLPVRVRVTLAFAGVLAVLLAATGLFLYVRLGDELDATIEQGLRSRASDVAALVSSGGSRLSESGGIADADENLAQVLDSGGRIVDSTPGLSKVSLLPASQLGRARRRTVIVDLERIPGGEDAARVLASPVGDRIVVVGAQLGDRNEALSNLAGLLLLGGPVALLLASLAGYGAAAAALRPVERMRRQAAEIQEAGSGQRLAAPPAHDEIGRLGDTLNRMLERLDEAFARERSFVSDASHELRTPLAILKAELEVALRAGRTEAELRAALESAADETDRLVQLAEDLLVIARSDQGRLPIRQTEIEAAAVLAGVRERFARRADGAGAEIAVTNGAGVSLRADPLRLEQALGNLVDNALRYGGPRIELSVAETGDGVELHVRDDGRGFPDGFVDHAFERFTRGDSARGRGGAGLGLAIVDVIARAHGGRAGAENPAEGGAHVWLVLHRA
jgi:heavy metal sensor kinase